MKLILFLLFFLFFSFVLFFISLYQKVEQRSCRPCYIPTAQWSMNPSLFIFSFCHREKERKKERERERERGERKGERGHRWIISRSEVHRQEPPCWPPSIALHTNDELRISILREKGMKHERRASSVSEPGRESGCVYVRAWSHARARVLLNFKLWTQRAERLKTRGVRWHTAGVHRRPPPDPKSGNQELCCPRWCWMLPRYQTGFLWTVYRKGAWIANESVNFRDKYSVSTRRAL